jgi:hypothetical protein
VGLKIFQFVLFVYKDIVSSELIDYLKPKL